MDPKARTLGMASTGSDSAWRSDGKSSWSWPWRVEEGVKRFRARKLRLKVNESKSVVAWPKDRKFLGFSFTGGESVKRRIAPKGILRFNGTVNPGRLQEHDRVLGAWLANWLKAE